MKKRFFSIFCIFLIFLLASCDLMGGSLAEYMTEYKESAFLETYEISSLCPRDAQGTSCINEEGDITLFLRNPMKYEIGFEYVFNTASIQLMYNTMYMETDPIQFIPLSDDFSSYKMLFPAEFLEAIDTGTFIDSDLNSKDISGTINAFEKHTRRPFGSLSLTLHADSAPSSVCNGLMQLNRDPSEDDPMYILCFEIPHSARNNDFDTIKINNNTWKIEYDASRDSIPNGIKVTPYGGNRGELIANPVGKEDYDTPAIKTYPLEVDSDDYFTPSDMAEYDVFYYFTNDKQTDTETLYQITITDKAGLSTTCTLSNKAEKLRPVKFMTQEGYIFTSDINNEYQVQIWPGTETTSGKIAPNTRVEYMVDVVDKNGNFIRSQSEGWQGSRNGDITFGLPPNNTYDEFYMVTARTKGSGFLSSDVESMNIFQVLRSNHFFVLNTDDGSDDWNNGTLPYPYCTLGKCMEAITNYDAALTEYQRKLNTVLVPDDGYYIDVMSDYSGSFSYSDDERYYLLSNSDFSGTLTVQGVDDTGKNAKLRTINACGSEQYNRGCVSWTNGTLNMKNLRFIGGYLSSASYDTVCYGAGVQIVDSDDSPVTATLTNCEFEKNIITSTWNRDEDPWPITFCGGAGLAVITGDTRSLVTIDGCSFTENSVSGNSIGAGICILSTVYGNPTGTVIIKGNTTVSYNRIEMFQGAGVYTDGKLIIESATIENNTTSEEKGAGAGFTANTCSDVTIKGKTIIENNTNQSGGPSNAYLACNTDNGIYSNQKMFTIAGDISGSRIGVTTGMPWEEGADPITFATYTSNYKPATGVFFSEQGYSIVLGSTQATIMQSVPFNGTVSLVVDDLCFKLKAKAVTEDDMTDRLYYIECNKLVDGQYKQVDADIEVISYSINLLDWDIPQKDPDNDEIDWWWVNEDGTMTVSINFVSELYEMLVQDQKVQPLITVIFKYHGAYYSLYGKL